MITEIKLSSCYQYRAASGTVRCRVGNVIDGGKITVEFLNDGKWVTSQARLTKAQLLAFLNSSGGKEIPAPEGVSDVAEAPKETVESLPEAVKVPRAPKPKVEQTGPSTQELCLAALSSGPKATGDVAKEIGKPTAAVNSAMSALERAGKVTSLKTEAIGDAKSFITWTPTLVG